MLGERESTYVRGCATTAHRDVLLVLEIGWIALNRSPLVKIDEWVSLRKSPGAQCCNRKWH
jgi:hypothetical protein